MRVAGSLPDRFPYGFHVRVERSRTTSLATLATRADAERDERRIAAPGVAVIARPLRVTPESLTEELPVVTPRCVLVYVGQVARRAALARALGRDDLAEAGDGALLAAAFEAWGPGFLARVDGDAVVVAIDRRDGTVVASPDALGTRRLFVRERPDALELASDEAWLVEPHDGVAHDALAAYLGANGLLPPDRSLHAGVRGVPGGHALVDRAGRREVVRWWHPPRQVARSGDDREHERALLDLLREAVDESLRAVGPVLTDLSGGLDSSTVTALAARGARRDRLIAFTSLGDKVATCDEVSFQDDFFARYPLERETVDLTRVLPFGALRPDVAAHPAGGLFSGVEFEALTAMTDRLGARVWLCGLGGDQLFWGPGLPPLYLADELRRRPLRWIRQAAGFAVAGDWHVRDLLRWSAGRPDARFASQPMPHWLRPRFRDAVSEYLAERDRPTGLVDDAGTDLQLRFLTLGVNASSMRPLACEIRYPLLYRPLVEWTLATPWPIRMRAGETRSLQRRALRDLLPASIARRESKSVFDAFIPLGLAAHWAEVAPLVEGEALADLGVLEPRPFREACLQLRHGHRAAGPDVAIALSLEAWVRHRRSVSAARPPSAVHDPFDP